MGEITRSSPLGGLSELSKRLSDADNKKTQVGWFESARYDDGKPVAGVAAVQEFGSAKMGIPPRPFMRPTIEEQSESWGSLVGSGARAVVNGSSTMTKVLSGLGLQVVGDIQKTIVSSDYQALSPVTIALRKLRDDGVQISGKTVGMVASAIADGKTGSGELGDQTYGNTDPLRDTGYMLATLTSETS